MKEIKSEDSVEYSVTSPTTDNDNEVIAKAIQILERRLKSRRKENESITSCDDSKWFLRLKLADREQEVFACLFLDNRNRVISFDELFYGTIDGANVHPREVVKAALKHNASSAIFAHNHPSGVAEPSQADQRLTRRLQDALSLVDVRVLDHIVVGEGDPVSFAERVLILPAHNNEEIER